MNVLAMDTSLGAISVSVRCGPPSALRRADACEVLSSGHAERLVPMVADVMAEAGLEFPHLQRVAVTLGPGTFTGVRTAIATARAFRLATACDVVGMTTLALMASGAFASGVPPAGRLLMIALDARRGGLYAQTFAGDAEAPLGPPVELTADEAVASLAGRPAAVVGSGVPLVIDAARRLGADVVSGMSADYPSAAHLADLAPGLAPLRDIVPLYVRPPDAKPQIGKSLARSA
jgi:tRNA threonylcarbamoyl adenosine modification protein YeaZ